MTTTTVPTVKLAYSVKEAAEATSLSVTHINTAIRNGDLKVRRTTEDQHSGRVGGRCVIRAVDLVAYIDNLPEG